LRSLADLPAGATLAVQEADIKVLDLLVIRVVAVGGKGGAARAQHSDSVVIIDLNVISVRRPADVAVADVAHCVLSLLGAWHSL